MPCISSKAGGRSPGAGSCLPGLGPRRQQMFQQLVHVSRRKVRHEISKTFASLAKLGLLTEADVDPLIARVSVVPASQSAAALSDAGIVFEGVPEVVALKRNVLGAASKQVGPNTIIASTTSPIGWRRNDWSARVAADETKRVKRHKTRLRPSN